MSTIAPACETVRLGCVSYLNTLPLIEGIGKLDRARLTLTAPSRLIDLLTEKAIDVGLISLIDYQRSADPLAMIPAGVIACDGPTMTVRIFARRPLSEVTHIATDVDSHTAVALMRILMQEQYGIAPTIAPLDLASGSISETDPDHWPDAMLVIGDKVITSSPPAALYPHQLDLGLAWKELTGLPFVYAIWMCHADRLDSPEVQLAGELLDRQRRHNAGRVGWIAAQRSHLRGWPADLARDYLCDLLHFNVSARDREAIDRFFDLAAKHGIIDERRPTVWSE